MQGGVYTYCLLRCNVTLNLTIKSTGQPRIPKYLINFFTRSDKKKAPLADHFTDRRPASTDRMTLKDNMLEKKNPDTTGARQNTRSVLSWKVGFR